MDSTVAATPPAGQFAPGRSAASELLEVRDLSIAFQHGDAPVTAVRKVNFRLHAGQTLGIVGESGCGKSLTIQAVMSLLPEAAHASGSIRFQGTELLGAPDAQLRRVRGRLMGMVFQEPTTALNPVYPVGKQVAEPLRVHLAMSAREARDAAIALLQRVGIPDAARRADAYPHQFSGGQRQRITLAMALACNPSLLLADEPTTALDVTVARQILTLIQDLVRERHMAMILVSHDLGLISESVERILVMYGGMVVEDGPTDAIFTHMAHPYTRGLFASRPRWNFASDGQHQQASRRLASIPGTVPELRHMPLGCPFAPRCSLAVDACHTTLPPVVSIGPDHHVRCSQVQGRS